MLSKRRRRGLTVFLLASTALSSAAFALDPSGTAVRITRITTADGPGGNRVLETEGLVYQGDEISTDPNGLAQIEFVDETKIVVGPNSRLVIDSFVFSSNNTAQDVTVDTVKGFFRFISGNSPHEAYTIRTPTMTIGLRGTALDIHAGAGSHTTVLDGSVFACDAFNECMEFLGDCTLYYAPSGGGFESPEGLDRRLQMSAYFPFIANPGMVDPSFRLDTTDCTLADNRLTQDPPQSGDSRNTTPPQPYQ